MINYLVASDKGEPEEVETLAEARKLAKELSLTEGQVTIQKWRYDRSSDDMVCDENFLLVYEEGKDVSKQSRERFEKTVRHLMK